MHGHFLIYNNEKIYVRIHTRTRARILIHEPPFSKGRERQFIGQRMTAVRGARCERAQSRARAVTQNGDFITPFEKDGLRQQAEGGFALKG